MRQLALMIVAMALIFACVEVSAGGPALHEAAEPAVTNAL